MLRIVVIAVWDAITENQKQSLTLKVKYRKMLFVCYRYTD